MSPPTFQVCSAHRAFPCSAARLYHRTAFHAIPSHPATLLVHDATAYLPYGVALVGLPHGVALVGRTKVPSRQRGTSTWRLSRPTTARSGSPGWWPRRDVGAGSPSQLPGRPVGEKSGSSRNLPEKRRPTKNPGILQARHQSMRIHFIVLLWRCDSLDTASNCKASEDEQCSSDNHVVTVAAAFQHIAGPCMRQFHRSFSSHGCLAGHVTHPRRSFGQLRAPCSRTALVNGIELIGRRVCAAGSRPPPGIWSTSHAVPVVGFRQPRQPRCSDPRRPT